MITAVKTVIEEHHIKVFIEESHFLFKDEGIPETDALKLLLSVSKKGEWLIDTILSNTIVIIENEALRNQYRRFLISRKYGVLMNMPKGETDQYYITHTSDNCVLIDSPAKDMFQGQELIRKPTSTIVLSPDGKIKINEGSVYIFGNLLTPHGFTAKWNNKLGIYTKSGEVLLPCIFDYVENDEYLRFGELIYKGFKYHYSRINCFSRMTSEDLGWMGYDDIRFCRFVCEDLFYRISFRWYDDSDTIHDGAVTRYLSEDERMEKHSPFLSLPKEEKIRLSKENINELFGIIASYHHCFTNEEIRQFVEERKT